MSTFRSERGIFGATGVSGADSWTRLRPFLAHVETHQMELQTTYIKCAHTIDSVPCLFCKYTSVRTQFPRSQVARGISSDINSNFAHILILSVSIERYTYGKRSACRIIRTFNLHRNCSSLARILKKYTSSINQDPLGAIL